MQAQKLHIYGSGTFWAARKVPGLDHGASSPLRESDVLSGSGEWGCQATAGMSAEDISADAFLVQVLSIERSATLATPTTELVARAITPFQVFEELFLDFSWRRAEANAQEGCHDERRLQSALNLLHLNYDDDTGRARETHDMGPLRCSNCWARWADLSPSFFIRQSGKLFPQEVGFSLEAELRSDVNVEWLLSFHVLSSQQVRSFLFLESLAY